MANAISTALSEYGYNPLPKIWAVGSSEPYFPNMPAPAVYSMEYEDVSRSDAGRTEDGTMHKLRLGKIVKITLEYAISDNATEMSTLLNAFDNEYFSAKYFNPYTNSYDSSKVFYAGNRTVPMYNARLGIWSNFKVNIIQRVLS